MEKTDKITMLHGAGGTVMHDLVKNYVVKAFGGIGNAEVPPSWHLKTSSASSALYTEK